MFLVWPASLSAHLFMVSRRVPSQSRPVFSSPRCLLQVRDADLLEAWSRGEFGAQHQVSSLLDRASSAYLLDVEQ